MLLENEGEILAMTETVTETYEGVNPIIVDNDNSTISLDISALSGQLSGDFADKETVDHLTACCEEVSGAISSLSANKEDKLVFGYDSDDSISSINGSAVGGQAGIPASAQETIDLVQSSSGTWNEVSSKLDISAFSSVSGDFATTGDLQNYATTSYVNNINTAIRNDMGTIATNTGYLYRDLSATSSFLSAAIDNKLDTSSFENISGSFYPMTGNPSGFITGVDLSNYYTKNETSGADELANAFSNIPAGDPDVNNAVHTYSGDWNSTYTTVHSNSATWDQNVSFTGVTTDATLTGDGKDTPLGVADTQTLSSDQSISITTAATGVILGVNSSWFDNAVNSAVTGTQGDAEVNAAVHNNSATWNTVTNKLDTTAFSTVSGTFLTAHQDLSNYVTETDLQSTSATITAMIPSTAGLATETDLQIVSGGVDYISGVALTSVDLTPYLTTATYAADSGTFATTSMLNDYQTTAGMTVYVTTGDISGTQWNSVYETVNTNSGVWNESYSTLTSNSSTWNNVSNKLDTTAFSTVSGDFLTAHQDISATEWNDCYETVQTNSGSWTGGSTYTGDAQGALDEVYTNSGNWNDVYTTVYNNSGSWTGGGGGSIDTIPFIVQSPLTTGISGYSAYIGLDGEAFESSAYVPFSALTDDIRHDGYVHMINGSGVYAVDASHSNYADYAYYDSNGNDLATTRYYAEEAYNTVQSNSANWSDGGTPVSGLELSAGDYITIVDDIQNSASIISVTGLATTGDLNYVSGVVGDVETLLASL